MAYYERFLTAADAADTARPAAEARVRAIRQQLERTGIALGARRRRSSNRRDGDVCTGREVCTTARTYESAGGLVCEDDGDPYSTVECDPKMGCLVRQVDGDEDGFSPGECSAGSPLRGGDCEDEEDTINPDATERSDDIDHDCDGASDEGGNVMVECRPDRDTDGFGDMSGEVVRDCVCPVGFVAPRADGVRDCKDRVADIRPQQPLFFSMAAHDHLPPFDYNSATA